MYILYELVNDYDMGGGSFYMCADLAANSNCKKLRFISPWDFGGILFLESPVDEYFAAKHVSEEAIKGFQGITANPWFVIFMKNDWFQEMVKERWNELNKTNILRETLKEEKKLIEYYNDELLIESEEGLKRSYNVINWMEKRIDWLDSEFLT